MKTGRPTRAPLPLLPTEFTSRARSPSGPRRCVSCFPKMSPSSTSNVFYLNVSTLLRIRTAMDMQFYLLLRLGYHRSLSKEGFVF
jgi:hypothetical protein